MRKLYNKTTWFLIFLFFPVLGYSQFPVRKYIAGETYKYKLTTDTWQNDKYTGEAVSISEHRVINDGGAFAEEIKWLNKTAKDASDTIRVISIARMVPAYRISLAPEGKVLLPKLFIPEMVGEITDLNTFFVAISPALNAQKLTAENRDFKNAGLQQGHFADSISILYGTDCIQVSQHLLSSNKKYTTIRTNFTPPDSFCLSPLLDTVTKKLYDLPNNFQMIRKGNGDKVNFFWGIESFTITSKLDNKTGAIQEASMENILTLQMRYNASSDLKTYAV
ncbi:hypothetical protein A3860_03670 [Niastella vici]|uniref:Uncharacterized protein n=1 Tax=Niastella vici TaxID=1703345 RepID=A0A1V9FXL5_9BACT|nr:hypothetical protein [Niastella vici]OQP63082.1 hypothetical protein A3860_03670 [Niastella vici]